MPYTHIRAHTHARMHACMHTHMHARMHAHTYARTHACTHTLVRMYWWRCTHTNLYVATASVHDIQIKLSLASAVEVLVPDL